MQRQCSSRIIVRFVREWREKMESRREKAIELLKMHKKIAIGFFSNSVFYYF